METVEGSAWARIRARPLYSLSHLGWVLRARLAGALEWPSFLGTSTLSQ